MNVLNVLTRTPARIRVVSDHETPALRYELMSLGVTELAGGLPEITQASPMESAELDRPRRLARRCTSSISRLMPRRVPM